MKRLRRIFMKLAEVNTPTGFENRIFPYIIQRLSYCGFRIAIDKNFNIMAYRGLRHGRKLPLLCAHSDTVSSSKATKLNLVYNSIRKTIHTSNSEGVLGGDDKCGIAIILRIAEIAKKDNLKFAILITRGEERGDGASSANKDIYTISKYAIVIDRRGTSDLIGTIGSKKLCSDDFLIWVESNAPEKIKPNKTGGAHSDAAPISDHLDVVNISCGYHDPHSNNEYVDLNHTYETMKWVKNMLKNPYIKPKEVKKEPEKTVGPVKIEPTNLKDGMDKFLSCMP